LDDAACRLSGTDEPDDAPGDPEARGDIEAMLATLCVESGQPLEYWLAHTSAEFVHAIDAVASKRAAAVGLSGGISGALIGGAGSMLASANPRNILRAIGLGALGGAGIAGGANVAGSLAYPGEQTDDPSINTRRGGVGGGVMGAVGGAALGAAGSRFGASPTSAVGKIMQGALARRFGPLLGAGLGAAGGAGVGAFVGSDEGMQYDAILNEIRRRGAEL
jgi:hypothetical protein